MDTADKPVVVAAPAVHTKESVIKSCTDRIASIKALVAAMEVRELADEHSAFLNDVVQLIKLKDSIRIEIGKEKKLANNGAVSANMEKILTSHVRVGTLTLDDFDAALTLKDLEKLLLMLQKLEVSYQLPALILGAWDSLPGKLVEWDMAWSFSTAKSPGTTVEDVTKHTQKRTSLSGDAKKLYAALPYDKKAAHHLNLAIQCVKEIAQLTELYNKLVPKMEMQQRIEGLSVHAAFKKPLLEKAKETTRTAYV